ncbi:hypothetical protein [Bifidobacterium callimiconis]|nr:hypothetical protein [Bifidobacterium callimiconis]
MTKYNLKRIQHLLFCLVLLPCMFLSGCGIPATNDRAKEDKTSANVQNQNSDSSADSSSTGSIPTMTWEKSNEEYQNTVSTFPFTLRNGDSFPNNMSDDGGKSTLYAEGWGQDQAYFYWECSTERYILDNHQTDSAGTQEALNDLRKMTETNWYKTYIEDPDNNFVNDVITPAGLGDVSMLQEFYQSDCIWYRKINNIN